ncbi:hypothetical protein PCE1_001739 [Barthelona sp. PCE]
MEAGDFLLSHDDESCFTFWPYNGFSSLFGFSFLYERSPVEVLIKFFAFILFWITGLVMGLSDAPVYLFGYMAVSLPIALLVVASIFVNQAKYSKVLTRSPLLVTIGRILLSFALVYTGANVLPSIYGWKFILATIGFASSGVVLFCIAEPRSGSQRGDEPLDLMSNAFYFVFCAAVLMLIKEYNPTGTYYLGSFAVDVARYTSYTNTIFTYMLGLMPFIVLIGLVTHPKAFLGWVLEQIHIYVFGGSAATSFWGLTLLCSVSAGVLYSVTLLDEKLRIPMLVAWAVALSGIPSDMRMTGKNVSMILALVGVTFASAMFVPAVLDFKILIVIYIVLLYLANILIPGRMANIPHYFWGNFSFKAYSIETDTSNGFAAPKYTFDKPSFVSKIMLLFQGISCIVIMPMLLTMAFEQTSDKSSILVLCSCFYFARRAFQTPYLNAVLALASYAVVEMDLAPYFNIYDFVLASPLISMIVVKVYRAIVYIKFTYSSFSCMGDFGAVKYHIISLMMIPFFVLLLAVAGILDLTTYAFAGAWPAYMPAGFRQRKFWDKYPEKFQVDQQGGGSSNDIGFYVRINQTISESISRDMFYGRYGYVPLYPGVIFMITNMNHVVFVHVIEIGVGFVRFQARCLELNSTPCHSTEMSFVQEMYDKSSISDSYLGNIGRAIFIGNPISNLKPAQYDLHFDSTSSAKMNLNNILIDNDRLIGFIKWFEFAAAFVLCSPKFFGYVPKLAEEAYADSSFLQGNDVFAHFNADEVDRYQSFSVHCLEKLVNYQLDHNGTLPSCDCVQVVQIIQQLRYQLLANANYLKQVTSLGKHDFGKQADFTKDIIGRVLLMGFEKQYVASNIPRDQKLPSYNQYYNVICESLRLSLYLTLESYNYTVSEHSNNEDLYNFLFKAYIKKEVFFAAFNSNEWLYSKVPRRISIAASRNENGEVYEIVNHQLSSEAFFVATVKEHTVRHFWASTVQEILVLRSTQTERASIQSNPMFLRNLLVSSTSMPYGYPICNFAPTTSFLFNPKNKE